MKLIQHVDRADDPRVGDVWRLTDPALVRRRGCFIAEGRLVVQRLLRERKYRVRALLLSEAARSSLASDLEELPGEVEVIVCRAADFLPITGFNIHRGCLALVERPADVALGTIVERARAVVVIEGVTNADNVGGVFRNAAAFAADAVLLSPSACDPLYRKAIRTSMGAALQVPFTRIVPWPEGLACLRAEGFTMLALTPRKGALSLYDSTLDAIAGKVALLVGNESEGLTPAAEALADYRVRIPMAPTVDSLNLAVATGVALSRLFRAA